MKEKKETLVKLSPRTKAAFATLAARPEFKVFEEFCLTQENNIAIEAFGVNSSDPHLAVKKAWHEGRLWELRKLVKVLISARKGADSDAE